MHWQVYSSINPNKNASFLCVLGQIEAKILSKSHVVVVGLVQADIIDALLVFAKHALLGIQERRHEVLLLGRPHADPAEGLGLSASH